MTPGIGLLFWCGAVVLAASLMCLLIGWLGPRHSHEPRCRCCGQGLRGVVPDDAGAPITGDRVCPECGASLVIRGAIRRESRRRRRGWLWMSLALGVVGLAGMTPGTLKKARGVNLVASAPVRVIALALPTADGTLFTQSVDEIMDRFVAGELSSADMGVLAHAALKRMEMGTVPSDDRLHSIIHAAFDRGQLEEEEVEGYLRRCVTPILRGQTQYSPGRLSVSWGFESLFTPYQQHYASARMSSIPVVLELVEASLDDEVLPDNTSPLVCVLKDNLQWTHSLNVPRVEGERRLKVRMRVRIDESLWSTSSVYAGGMSGKGRADAAKIGHTASLQLRGKLPPLSESGIALEWEEDLQANVTLKIVPDLPFIKVRDESLVEGVRKAIKITCRASERDSSGKLRVWMIVDENALPISMFLKRRTIWNGAKGANAISPGKTPIFLAAPEEQGSPFHSGSSYSQTFNHSPFITTPPADWDGTGFTLILEPSYDEFGLWEWKLRDAETRGRKIRVLDLPVHIDVKVDGG